MGNPVDPEEDKEEDEDMKNRLKLRYNLLSPKKIRQTHFVAFWNEQQHNKLIVYAMCRRKKND